MSLHSSWGKLQEKGCLDPVALHTGKMQETVLAVLFIHVVYGFISLPFCGLLFLSQALLKNSLLASTCAL